MSPDASGRIDPESLLANAAWVRALAMRLVRDDADADDVVQDTLVAAIETPPRGDVPLRPWLARVARNFALKSLRSDERRGRREAAATGPAESSSTGDSVARTEMFHEVVGAVLALEPTYRDVVILRFFDGLETRDVAVRLGVPVETARTRLKRALAMLRDRLDRKYGERRAWALLVPITSPRLPTPVGAAVAGAWVMGTTKVVVAALGAAALLAAFLLLRTGEPTRDGSAVADSTAADHLGPSRSRAAGATPATAPTVVDAPAETAASPTAPTPVRARLRGELVDGSGRVRGSAKLHLAPVGIEAEVRIDATSAQDGSFDVDVSRFFADAERPSEVVVEVDHPECLPREERIDTSSRRSGDASSTETFDVRVVLQRAALLTGTTVDDSGRPVAGADVGAFAAPAAGESSSGRIDNAVSDASGAWRLRLPPGRDARIVAAAADRVPAWRRVAASAVGELREAPIVLASGVAVAGRVTDGAGRPIAGAEVEVWAEWRAESLRAGEREVTLDADGARVWPAETVSDADGAYRVGGLVAGETHRVLVRAPGCALDLQAACEREATVPATGVDFVVAGGRLVVEVTSAGAPVPKASLMFHGRSAVNGVSADDAGRAALVVTPDASYEIHVDARGFESAVVKVQGPRAGTEHVERVELKRPAPRASLVIVVRSEDGSVAERVAVDLMRPGQDVLHADGRETTAGADGKFRFDGIDAGPRRVRVRPGGRRFGGTGYLLPAALDVDFAAAGVVEREVAVGVGGRLRIEVRASDGRRLQASCVLRNSLGARVPVVFVERFSGENTTSSADFVGSSGPSSVEPVLPAGRYTVELTPIGRDSVVREVTVERGTTTDVSVTLSER